MRWRGRRGQQPHLPHAVDGGLLFPIHPDVILRGRRKAFQMVFGPAPRNPPRGCEAAPEWPWPPTRRPRWRARRNRGRQPQGDAAQGVKNRMARPDDIEQQHEAKDSPGRAQPEKGNIPTVEQGDHQHSADVVDNSHRRQKDLEAGRHPAAEQRQDAQGKGDVRGHGNAPADLTGRPPGQEQEQQRRHGHAADGGHHRQQCLAQGIEFPDQDLPLDFQAHHEKENDHEPVVDPMAQRQGQGRTADLQGHRRRPQGDVAPGPGRIGP